MNLNRYRRITWFFARIILQIGFFDIILARLGFRKYINRTRPERLRRIAIRYRELAIEMGGVLIKVGQFLSARVDVLPEDITDELSGLQDEVPAEEFDDIRQVAEEDLGVPLNQIFSYVDPKPMASASLGQVHRARLKFPGEVTNDGQEAASQPAGPESEEVVIKIQRPNIEKIITTDLAAIRTVGSWLQHYRPIRKRADVPSLVREFSRVLYEEIDYLAEGRNIEIFGDHFNDDSRVLVPKVIWSHTTRKVLTMGDVVGIKIDAYDELEAAGVDRHEVAVVVLQVYFKQIFEDGFFHADPHPGNLFIKVNNIDHGKQVPWVLTFVDFGMVGRISQADMKGLREILIAFATRDTDRLVRSYQMLNLLLPEADIDLIQQADASAFDLFWGKNMSELKEITPEEVRELLGEFRDLVYKMPFQLPHDLIFLARAIGLLSGLCTGLDPEINVWEQIVPYAQKLLRAESGVFFQEGFQEMIKKILSESGPYFQKILALPNLTYTILEKIDQGNIVIRDPKLEELLRGLKRSGNRMAMSVVFAAFLFTTVQLYLSNENTTAIIVGVLSALIFLWMILLR